MTRWLARKPDPAPYRQAMDALGVEPGDCVVIEDSRAGIGAGAGRGRSPCSACRPTQAVAPAAGLTVRASLVGVGIPFLEQLLQPRDLASIDA